MSGNPTYLPDFMLITLPATLSVIVDKDNGLDLSNPIEASLLMHEWLHYIHNTSTTNGIYLFASMITLWSDFRWKLDKDGYSTSSEKLEKERLFSVLRAHANIHNSRNAKAAAIELKQQRYDFKALSATLTIEPLIKKLPDWKERKSTITCELQVGTDPALIPAQIGVIEILEGLAFLLEERYLEANNLRPSTPAIAPYQLVFKLARLLVPSIDKEDVIRCCIASLHSEDPPKILAFLLKKATTLTPGKLRSEAKDTLKKYLAQNKNNFETIFSMVDNLFPKGEAMARSVKFMTKLMRTNLKRRMKHPFFELEILEDLKNASEEQRPRLLASVFARTACCRLYLTRQGLPDQISRDDIVVFSQDPEYSQELAFGHNKIHATFHYMMLHLYSKGFRTTDAVLKIKPAHRRCPFYSACPYELRVTDPEICNLTPWKSLSLTTPPGDSCWYREGVRAARRPDDEKIQSVCRAVPGSERS